ncbi:hypothetical protein E6C67_08135 [Azospirillum sp. TSA2s]|uniref:hypothetical protein n=1 Tax=Azospirillum sp. TSA2s TaxID=709810 RepID=UPI0010AAED0E|nr:hypothetical protein [Azospirillum sp. TSA2s]QCG93909.1 hypothetical protein E6C67_08135 [Azospirillum sp. TSA2s]
MSNRSRLRRQERRATITRKQAGLSARDALDIADNLDLPDGAAYAFAAELAGLEYGDFFDQLSAE